MIDAATLSLWGTDLVLLVLAYAIGRMHGYYLSCQHYRAQLDGFIAEVRALHRAVDRLRDLEIAKK
jgi:hypothetical protein